MVAYNMRNICLTRKDFSGQNRLESTKLIHATRERQIQREYCLLLLSMAKQKKDENQQE